jgi:hypothetical protein
MLKNFAKFLVSKQGLGEGLVIGDEGSERTAEMGLDAGWGGVWCLRF